MYVHEHVCTRTVSTNGGRSHSPSFTTPPLRAIGHRDRDAAYDPVAHFHLRNGAVVARLCWRADMSPRGVARSWGVMVNYRYDRGGLDQNSQDYQLRRRVHADAEIQQAAYGTDATEGVL